MIIECKLTFESAHRNTSAEAPERARRLHGHSYEATVAVTGAIDPAIGWVMDFAEVKDRAGEVIDQLDHRVLNDMEGMHNATRVDVERWLTNDLRRLLPTLHECRLNIIGDRNWTPVISRPEPGRERLRFGFDAAHFLPTLPDLHKCRRIHGHSFRVAVNSVNAGWLAEPVREIYESLDHRLLNEIAGLQNPTSELLAQWLLAELKHRKCSFEDIMVAETCTSSCRIKNT
jgi:6-pyruvoyltetrahydropterin/6-carboxytetrahydropterin synthase